MHLYIYPSLSYSYLLNIFEGVILRRNPGLPGDHPPGGDLPFKRIQATEFRDGEWGLNALWLALQATEQ
jgi:hypothetical protein